MGRALPPRRSPRRHLLGLSLGVVAAAASHASPAHGQSAANQAAAEALFDQGKAAMAAKNYAEACPKFFESNKLDQGIGTSLWLADCYEMNGQTASAWAEFREAAGLAVKANDTREKVARDRAQALEGKLARLVLLVPPTSRLPGLHVARDGGEVAAALWGTSVPVDPGRHTVVASAPDHRPQTLSIEIVPGPGEQALIVPPLVELPQAPAGPLEGAAGAGAAGPTIAGLPLPRAAAVAAGALGVVSLALGSYFGLHAGSELDASNANGHCGARNLCDATGVADRSSAQSAATASTVLFVVAGAALAGGGVLWFTSAPPARSAAPAGAGGAAMTRVSPWLDARGGGVVLATDFE